MKKYRILHVLDMPAFGGIERMLLTLAQTQHLFAHVEHEFAGTSGSLCVNELKLTKAKVYEFGFNIKDIQEKIIQVLDLSSYDVVICHRYKILSIIAKIIQERNIPLVLWCHGAEFKVYKMLVPRLPLNLVIFNSHFNKQFLESVQLKVPVEVIYPPAMIPEEKSLDQQQKIRTEIRKRLNTPLKAFVFLQSGRVYSKKGHDVMVDALKLLSERGQINYYYWIIGLPQDEESVEYMQALKLKCKEYNLENRVKWLGYQNPIDKYLIASDAACQPNNGEAEPFGLFFIEALYYGRPLLTSTGGGASEILQNDLGYLLPSGDAMALAGAIEALTDAEKKCPNLVQLRRERAFALSNPILAHQALENIIKRLKLPCLS